MPLGPRWSVADEPKGFGHSPSLIMQSCSVRLRTRWRGEVFVSNRNGKRVMVRQNVAKSAIIKPQSDSILGSTKRNGRPHDGTARASQVRKLRQSVVNASTANLRQTDAPILYGTRQAKCSLAQYQAIGEHFPLCAALCQCENTSSRSMLSKCTSGR